MPLAEVGVALSAVRVHRETNDWPPTHHEFAEAYMLSARRAENVQQRERMLSAPTVCGTCDGLGWIEVVVVGGKAEQRCETCNKRPPVDEHPKKCQCLDCHYGAKRAAIIRSGRDGLGPRHGPDLLKPVGVSVQDRF